MSLYFTEKHFFLGLLPADVQTGLNHRLSEVSHWLTSDGTISEPLWSREPVPYDTCLCI